MTVDPFVNVEGLSIDITTARGTIHAVRDVSFTVERGKTLCIVGGVRVGKIHNLTWVDGAVTGVRDTPGSALGARRYRSDGAWPPRHGRCAWQPYGDDFSRADDVAQPQPDHWGTNGRNANPAPRRISKTGV